MPKPQRKEFPRPPKGYRAWLLCDRMPTSDDGKPGQLAPCVPDVNRVDGAMWVLSDAGVRGGADLPPPPPCPWSDRPTEWHEVSFYLIDGGPLATKLHHVQPTPQGGRWIDE